MREVYLHGELAEKYGSEPILLDAATPQMITRGLIHRFGNELREYFRENYFKFVMTNNGNEKAISTDIEAAMPIDDETEVHITPAIEGSGRFGQIIAGIVLIVVGYIFPVVGAYTIPAGIAMVAGGVVQLLAGSPRIDDYQAAERKENQASFLFNGSVNVYEQGGPVPLVYGRVKAGSVVIGAGFDIEQIPYHNSQYPDYPDGPRRRRHQTR